MIGLHRPEQMVLVNEMDEVRRGLEKHQAHRRGVQHRAFSSSLFVSADRLVLQQRTAGKYYPPSRWTNSWCSLPGSGEEIKLAAVCLLQHQLGLRAVLEHRFDSFYEAHLGFGSTEYELDQVFVGRVVAGPGPDSEEIPIRVISS